MISLALEASSLDFTTPLDFWEKEVITVYHGLTGDDTGAAQVSGRFQVYRH
jgi:hypothetical protein